MKIGFMLTSFCIGGIEKVFLTLANEMCKCHDVSIVVCKNRGDLLELKDSRVKSIDLGGISLSRLFFPLIKTLKRQHFDVFISGSDIVNIFVGGTKLFCPKKTKIILTQHNFFNSESVYIGNKIITRLLMRFFYNISDQVIAVSNSVKEFCIKELKCKKTIEIQNPVDLARVKVLKDEPIDTELPENYLLFAGRLSVVKNIPLILRAMRVLHERGKRINLLILGDGSEGEKLKEIVKELDLQETVKFIGSVPNVFPYMKNGEMLLMASTSEAFPVTIVESFSLGIPVISTKTEGPLEIMGNLKTNYFVDSFTDEKEYADKIEFILNLHVDKSELIDCAKQYSVENIVDKYMKVFEKLKNEE